MSIGFSAPLDLRAGDPGEWIVLADITYTALDGAQYTILRGFITDLASIPRLLRPVFDQNDATREPAVAHDWLYCFRQTTRAQADAIFLEALGRSGVGLAHRWALYLAVRTWGWLYWGRRNGLTMEDFSDAEAFP